MMLNLFDSITQQTSAGKTIPTYTELFTDLGVGGPRKNLWVGTPFEHYYLYPNSKRGQIGEEVISEYIKRTFNIIFTARTDTSHDRNTVFYESGSRKIPVEMKTSLATNGKRDAFVFNHIALSKNFERLILLGVNIGDTSPHHLYWMSREDIQRAINQRFFSRQQGGKHGTNDDYMWVTSPKKIGILRQTGLLHQFDAWR